jgi:CheY-like chemotaxis protein
MEEPCVILLDLMMPVMSGGEFLSILRQSDAFATLPVVVVSAWPQEAAKLSDQIQGFVKKPVVLDTLLDLLERYCEVCDE